MRPAQTAGALITGIFAPAISLGSDGSFVALRLEIEHLQGVIQEQSAHDDISGPDPGLHVRTDHSEHIGACRADGVRDVGGEIAVQPVQDAVYRHSQTIHPGEGDHYAVDENPIVKIGSKAVPGKRLKGHAYFFGEHVELASRKNNRIGR
jgi:hypothetical protein